MGERDAGKSTNITWSRGTITRAARERLLRQRGCVVWFTGLSGSGKSTLSHALEERLVQMGQLAYVLDGDNLRHGLNRDLGFSAADRQENIRRAGEVAALMADMGAIVLTAFISPYRADRALARERMPGGRFVEVYLDVPVAVCEERDPKGLYAKARAGEIQDFTGIDAPYEAPTDPDVSIDTSTNDPASCVDQILAKMRAMELA